MSSTKTFLYVTCWLAFVTVCRSEENFAEKQEQDDTKTKYPWTISFELSTRDDSERRNGTVEMVLFFEDQSRESFIASDDTFAVGTKYRYPVTFSTNSKLQYAYVRTSGMCQNPMRLLSVKIVSEFAGVAYDSWFDNTVKDKCNGQFGTVLKDFHETLKSLYCIDGDKRRENGETYNTGCTLRCTCVDGRSRCVDMCPPYVNISPFPCQHVQVAGECCQTDSCQNQWASGDCERPDLKRFTAEFNNGYPSAVYVCSDKECLEERVGAVLISDEWALAPFVADWSVEESHLFIARSGEADIRRFALSQIISNETAQLTLFKLANQFSSSLNTQYANLPIDANVCSTMTARRQCPYTMVGWNFPKPDGPVMEVVGGHSVDAAHLSGQCQHAVPGNQTGPTICLSDFSSSSPCRMQHGGPVFVQIDKDVNYLVGMKVWRSTKKSTDCNPVSGASEPVVNLCSALDWIDKILVTRPRNSNVSIRPSKI